MKVTNHDNAERTCFTCANSFVDEDSYHDTYLCCVKRNGEVVEDDESCEDWNRQAVKWE